MQMSKTLIRGLSLGVQGAVVIAALSLSSSAWSQQAYILGVSQNASNVADGSTIGLLDLSTGTVTGAVSTSVILSSLAAAPDGTIYGASNGSLYSVDPTSGVATLKGTAASGYILGSSASGLYGVAIDGTNPNQLDFFGVNTGNGATTALGTTTAIPTTTSSASGLSSNLSNLYAFADSGLGTNSFLYQVNPTTGATSAGLDTTAKGLESLTTVNGSNYAISDTNNTIYQVNTTSGVASATAATITSFASSVLVNSGTDTYYTGGIVPVPEAETYVAMLMGLFGLGYLYRKRAQ